MHRLRPRKLAVHKARQHFPQRAEAHLQEALLSPLAPEVAPQITHGQHEAAHLQSLRSGQMVEHPQRLTTPIKRNRRQQRGQVAPVLGETAADLLLRRDHLITLQTDQHLLASHVVGLRPPVGHHFLLAVAQQLLRQGLSLILLLAADSRPWVVLPDPLLPPRL